MGGWGSPAARAARLRWRGAATGLQRHLAHAKATHGSPRALPRDKTCPCAPQSCPHRPAPLELFATAGLACIRRGSMLLSAAAYPSPPRHAPTPFVSGPAACPARLKHWLSLAGAANQTLMCWLQLPFRTRWPPGSVAVPTSDGHLPATSSYSALIPQQGFPRLPCPPGPLTWEGFSSRERRFVFHIVRPSRQK